MVSTNTLFWNYATIGHLCNVNAKPEWRLKPSIKRSSPKVSLAYGNLGHDLWSDSQITWKNKVMLKRRFVAAIVIWNYGFIEIRERSLARHTVANVHTIITFDL